MNHFEAQQYLDSFINYEFHLHQVDPSSFRLHRIEKLLHSLGNPHQDLSFIHVAGSKGKGSTCAFVAHVLKAAGLRTGLYTSPHLWDVRERIRILDSSLQRNSPNDLFADSILIPDFCALVEELQPALEAMRSTKEYGKLTYFEVLTALALVHFAKKKVDAVVLETGLGGRLDATNVVDACVCAITPISLEHTLQLGDTVEKIAAEKVAIVKREGQGVVVSPQPSGAWQVIEQHCRIKKARMVSVSQNLFWEFKNFQDGKQNFLLRGIRGQEYLFSTRLLGRHQLENAATAVAIIELLKEQGWKISTEAMVAGMADAQWPGRLEIVAHDPTVILDGAHNASSCQKLVAAIQEMFPKETVTLILGLSRDKDKAQIIPLFKPMARHWIWTQAAHPRSAEFSPEITAIDPHLPWQSAPSVKMALDLARKQTSQDGIIVVTGSLFVVGEARKYA